MKEDVGIVVEEAYWLIRPEQMLKYQRERGSKILNEGFRTGGMVLWDALGTVYLASHYNYTELYPDLERWQYCMYANDSMENFMHRYRGGK